MAMTTLRKIFSDIANALRRKGVDKETIYPEEYADLIDGITVGDGLTDISDATATIDDVIQGKIFYGADGRQIGAIPITGDMQGTAIGISTVNNKLEVRFKNLQNRLLSVDAFIRTLVEFNNFGDAAPENVISGKTFTSAAGLKVTGTASLNVSKYATIYSGTNNVVFNDHSITINSAFFSSDISSITKFVGIQGSTWSKYPSNMSGKSILLGFYVVYDGQIARGVYTTGNNDINTTELGFLKTSSSIKISCSDDIYFYNSYQTLFE